MKNKWFSITNSTDPKTPAEIEIFDYIGGWETSALSFINKLKTIDNDRINLHINSPGGEVFDGIAIQNSLKHHKAHVTVYIDGLAASIASIIALAGDEIKIADNAYVMIHNPASIVWGEADELLKQAELLLKITDGLAADYSRKMGITADEARDLMAAETWYLGQEAVDAGFADSTFGGIRAAAHFDLSRVSAKAPADVLSRFSHTPKQHGTPIQQESHHMNKTTATTTKPQEPTPATPAAAAEPTPPVSDPKATVTAPEPEAAKPVDIDAAVKAALETERKRTAGINDISERFGFVADAKKFIEGGKTVDDFRAHILAKSPDDWKASLAVRNPSHQASEQELDDTTQGASAVAKIKERRQARYGK